MSKVSQFNSKDDIAEQASLWVSRLDRGIDAQEKKELVTWLNLSKAHYQALIKMAALWDDLTVLEELKNIFPLAKSHTTQKRNKLPRVLVASLFLVCLTTLSLLGIRSVEYLIPSSTSYYVQTYQTSLGQHQLFSLPDGSVLQLNTNSIVNVNFTHDKRFLTLVSGEASFDVVKDSERPFVVTVADQTFTALGTIFNIEKSAIDGIELVVTEGQVLISQANLVVDVLSDISNNISLTELKGVIVETGEKAVIEKDLMVPVKKLPIEQVEQELAWQSGMLIFDGKPLAEALIEVSRYNDINFIVDDPMLAKLKISGYFKAGDIDGLLQSLHYNFDIKYQKESKSRIHLSI